MGAHVNSSTRVGSPQRRGTPTRKAQHNVALILGHADVPGANIIFMICLKQNIMYTCIKTNSSWTLACLLGPQPHKIKLICTRSATPFAHIALPFLPEGSKFATPQRGCWFQKKYRIGGFEQLAWITFARKHVQTLATHPCAECCPK